MVALHSEPYPPGTPQTTTKVQVTEGLVSIHALICHIVTLSQDGHMSLESALQEIQKLRQQNLGPYDELYIYLWHGEEILRM